MPWFSDSKISPIDRIGQKDVKTASKSTSQLCRIRFVIGAIDFNVFRPIHFQPPGQPPTAPPGRMERLFIIPFRLFSRPGFGKYDRTRNAK
jgi:hypothetical protein